jgi:hypothetical protein
MQKFSLCKVNTVIVLFGTPSIHPMTLQPIFGLGLLSWGSVTAVFLWCGVVSPTPNPQPGGPGLHIYDPCRQGGPAIPPGTGKLGYLGGTTPRTHYCGPPRGFLEHHWTEIKKNIKIVKYTKLNDISEFYIHNKTWHILDTQSLL